MLVHDSSEPVVYSCESRGEKETTIILLPLAFPFFPSLHPRSFAFTPTSPLIMTGSPRIRPSHRPGLYHARRDVQAGAQVQERLQAGSCGWEDLGDLDGTKGMTGVDWSGMDGW